VSGTTFDPEGSLVNIYWDGTSGSRVGQAQVHPTDRTFSFSFPVPANATNGAHVVSATQVDRNGLAYNPVNRSFRVANGQPATRRSDLQGAAVSEQPDGATASGRAGQTATAAQPAARAAGVAAQAQAPAQAQPGAAAPGPVVGTQAGPLPPPPATGAESQQGAAAQQPAGSQEAFGTPVPAPAPAGAAEAGSSSGGPSPWLLVPLAILSLGFLGTGSSIFLRERKRTRVRA
jgi:hypothetical protein